MRPRQAIRTLPIDWANAIGPIDVSRSIGAVDLKSALCSLDISEVVGGIGAVEIGAAVDTLGVSESVGCIGAIDISSAITAEGISKAIGGGIGTIDTGDISKAIGGIGTIDTGDISKAIGGIDVTSHLRAADISFSLNTADLSEAIRGALGVSRPIGASGLLGPSALESVRGSIIPMSYDRFVDEARFDAGTLIGLADVAPLTGFSIDSALLRQTPAALTIDWGSGSRDALTVEDLTAPVPDVSGPGLAAFPPDLVEDAPLGSGVRIDAVVANSQAGAELFLAARSPVAADRMVAARRRLLEGDSEALSQALTSCRRALHALADEVYPARRQKVVDRTGIPRTAHAEAFKNRLLLFVDDAIESAGTLVLATAELDHVVARLDALVSKLDKGVHADVVRDEAHHAYVETWTFIAHVARLASSHRE